MAESRISREDVESAIGARSELGEDLEPAVVDAFLDRVERAIDARVATQLEEARTRRSGRSDSGQRLALSIVSLGTGIPVTAIAAEAGGILGIGLAWLGIVGVNVAQRLGRD
jgi:hypothetical protein